jgi:carbamoyltransferase
MAAGSMIVLGLSGGFGHDASACLVRDGSIVAMAEEERFRRQRHAVGMVPLQAAAFCLDTAGVTMSDVDCLAVSWEPRPETTPWPTRLHERLLRNGMFDGHRAPPVEVVGHHLAHAASSYYASGLERAAVLVVDGQGDGISSTLAYGSGNRIDVLRNFDSTHSIGFFFLALTDYLGFGFGEEGKTMGLAAHGSALTTRGPFQLTGDGYGTPFRAPGIESPYAEHRALIDDWMRWIETAFGPRSHARHRYDRLRAGIAAEPALTPRHADIAATGQAWLEEVVLHLVRLVVEETGCRDLVMAGGVALSCSANGRIRRSGLVDDLYVFPAAGDAGTSAGAALAAFHGSTTAAGGRTRVAHASFGPSWSDAEVERCLHDWRVAATCRDGAPEAAAQLLAEGRVVGWFQGAMEVGPRALGNRSILASPAAREMHDRVNGIKGREQWRPLGPSLPIERAGRFLDDDRPAPFMLTSCQVLPDRAAEVPAVVHTDGSCRPQLVTAEANAPYHRLLLELEARQGVPVVLNTSFNQRGQPIVCTPQDALAAFSTMGVDDLFIGGFHVTKRR